MESVFAVVDIFWVSHLGTDAAATVGLTESLLTLIYALAIGLSIGAMAMIARRIGEQNPDGAARAAVQAIALALIVSIVIGASRCATRAEAAGADGWLAVGDRARFGVHASDAGRQRHRRDALHDQRDLSRRGRCRDRDAHVVAGELDQHPAWSMFDLRTRTISETRHRRRRHRDEHRTRNGRTLRTQQTASCRRTIQYRATSSAHRTGDHRTSDPACQRPERFRSSSAWRVGSDSCASSRVSAATLLRVTRSAFA